MESEESLRFNDTWLNMQLNVYVDKSAGVTSAGACYRVADVDLLSDHPGVIEHSGVLLALLYHYVFVHRPPRRRMFFKTTFKLDFFPTHSFRTSDAAQIHIYQVYFIFISYISLIFIYLTVVEVQ